jgi:hypothetical protein
MDNTFAFRADRMPRRKIDPLALKAALMAAAVVAATGMFAKFVIDSEQHSLERAEARAHPTSTVAAEPIEFVDPEIDAPARLAAETALEAAMATLARDGSLSGAGPAELAGLGGLIFVDGPSTAPQVVSLAGSGKTWAAAVMGASGTCFYAKVTAAGAQTFGTGAGGECSGEAAMHAALLPSWPSWDV